MPKDQDGNLLCEVCEDEPAVGVACVPGIPVSAAYGMRCLQNNAHPYHYLRGNVACMGGPQAVIPEYLEYMNVYVQEDLAYMSIGHALWKHPLTPEELNDCWCGEEGASDAVEDE